MTESSDTGDAQFDRQDKTSPSFVVQDFTDSCGAAGASGMTASRIIGGPSVLQFNRQRPVTPETVALVSGTLLGAFLPRVIHCASGNF